MLTFSRVLLVTPLAVVLFACGDPVASEGGGGPGGGGAGGDFYGASVAGQKRRGIVARFGSGTVCGGVQ
jgi:hypothetical protein